MAEFREQIETILFGVMRVTKAVIPIMCEQRAGHILHFISFRGSIGGSVGRAPCSAAKWAVEGFSEVLANEVGALGLKVNVIEPGGFRTASADSSMSLRDGRAEDDEMVRASALSA